MDRKKLISLYGLILLSLFAVIFFSATFGAADIGLMDFLKALASKIPYIGDTFEIPKGTQVIIFGLRFPRILLAGFAGMGLAIAGTVFQSVFRNPLADPYLLGVSSGAAFGATLAAIIGIEVRVLSFGTMSVFAFVGAMVVVMILYKVALTKEEIPMTVLLLSGLAVNYFLTSLMTLMMTFHQDQIEAIYFWTLGSFKNANMIKVVLVGLIVLISSLFLYSKHREMDLLILGDEQAKSLGIETGRLKKRLLLVASLMGAIIVAASGIIGFVGLIVPHGVRLVSGPNHKRLMPMAAIVGAIFMIICDTIARSFFDNKELSIGILTSLFGVPFFLLLLVRNRRGYRL